MKTNLIKTTLLAFLLVLTNAVFSQITITETITNNPCNGDSNGQITLNVTGGVSPYTYNWSNGATTSDITGLSSGQYDVTVTDSNSDTQTGTYIVTEPAQITVAPNVTPVTCFGGNDGTIYVNVSGGTSPYIYNWSNGETTQTVNSLTAGTYSVTITDANACMTQQTSTVTEPTQINLIDTVFNSNGACNGLVGVTADLGNAPYIYNWSNGETTSQISNLCLGQFTVTVTDANGCEVTGTYLVGATYNDTTPTFVDTLQTSIDTCVFNNTIPVDSAYI